MASKKELAEFFQTIYHQVTHSSETGLSEYATRSAEAVRRFPEPPDPRSPFALDRDRILYSGAFRRYSGKTQVIYFASQLDEMLTSRIIHTLSVAQVSRTIGKFLSLNQELIEAIALSHDLGHPPFGHDGEKFLSQVCEAHGIQQYHHHIQSLHIVDRVAKKGRGLNLTLQVRDGILSHDGEVHNRQLMPQPGKREEDLQQYIRARKAGQYVDMMPMTLEGCVMRISDTIAYIGQDIEDAIRIGLITREDIPADLRERLGSTNGEIMDTLIKDVVFHSFGKPYVSFSEEVSDALYQLKQFNYERIYLNPRLKKDQQKIKRGFFTLFEVFLNDLKQGNKNSLIFRHFLDTKVEEYWQSTSDEEKVRDYIAGMTDRYFVEVLRDITVPRISLFD
ncbi:MAG: HD domain-containing protein [Calditrichaeota bacterium]|nr:MAG: HD domain-containing protein [Calditrichota bacterium]